MAAVFWLYNIRLAELKFLKSFLKWLNSLVIIRCLHMPFASQPVGKLHWVIKVCHNYPDREELFATGQVGRASMWSYAVQTTDDDDDDDDIMTLPISMVTLMTTCDI